MKTCKCLEELKKLTTEETGDPCPEGLIDQSFGISSGVFCSIPTLTVKARKKKKGGTFCVNATLRFPVEVTHCPLCGKPLAEQSGTSKVATP